MKLIGDQKAKRGKQMKKKKLTDKEEAQAILDKISPVMREVGYEQFVVFAKNEYSIFQSWNLPYMQLLRLRAYLDKLILENTE